MKIDGKIALITGGAQGLGLAICDALVQRGAKVTVVDIDKIAFEGAVKERNDNFTKNTMFIRADVTSKTQLENAFRKTVETFVGLDIVGNNAGIMDDVLWERQIEINLKATVHGIKLGEQYMSRSEGGKGGVIICMSSRAGLRPWFPYTGVYNATKSAVVAITKSYGHPDYWTETGIRYNCLCPHLANTELQYMKGKLLRDSHNDKWEEFRTSLAPEDLVQPAVVGKAFADLVEDDSMNGEAVEVSPTGWFRAK